jgi:hypothetical protein
MVKEISSGTLENLPQENFYSQGTLKQPEKSLLVKFSPLGTRSLIQSSSIEDWTISIKDLNYSKDAEERQHRTRYSPNYSPCFLLVQRSRVKA